MNRYKKMLSGYDFFSNKILENADAGIIVWTLGGMVVWLNEYAEGMFGFKDADLDNEPDIHSFFPEDTVRHIREIYENIEEKSLHYKYDCSLVLAGGESIFVSWHHYRIDDEIGNGYIVSIGMNISNIRKVEVLLEKVNNDLAAANEELVAQQEELSAMNEELMAQEEELKTNLLELQRHQDALKKSEERLRLVVEGSSDGLWDWDLMEDRVYISEQWSRMIGFDNQEISGYRKKWERIIHPNDVKNAVSNLMKCLDEKKPFYLCEYRIRLKNGKYIWITSKGKILWNEQGIPVRIAGSHTDITERKKTERKLKHMAYFDPLTDLPLRTIFMDRLNDAIANAKKSNSKLAVLFLDLDNFKSINDTYGHHIGDKLLKRIAVKLKSCIQKSDTISRMGGDEFVLLIPEIAGITEADILATRIITLFNEPLNVSGHTLYTSISIGVAVYPDSSRNGKALLKKADVAMYKAKEGGKSNLQYFSQCMGRQVKLRNELKKDLLRAIEDKEFFLCYQPLIDIHTRKTVSVEALIRWRHPKKGIISPVEFIPIAEETRLIIPIGDWVLETACMQLVQWHKMGHANLCLSVNVSIIQLQRPEFAESVCAILARTGLPTRYLDLEITESVLMSSTYIVVRNLDYLKKQGIRISIDDFGTGYSCFEYLQRFDINSLKIDRSFVDNIKVDINKAIIDAIISLGHDIHIEITAEGVETKDQYDYLKKKGCDKVQGYYFSKPLPPEEIIHVIEKKEP